MDSASTPRTDDPSDAQPAGGETERSGLSGEGAASALAHLKNQAWQQRRESGEQDERPPGG